MTKAAAGGLDERVVGRKWTVRLDATGCSGTTVRVTCSRPSCGEQRLPSTAEGRAAAVAHLKAHLKAAAEPRAHAFCACKSENCGAHIRPTTSRFEHPQSWRCGGAVVLAVIADREGRWWQAMECCSRCAAATPGTKIVSSAAAVFAPTASAPRPVTERPPLAAQFSDGSASAPLPAPPHAPGPRRVPKPRSTQVRRRQGYEKIAQRIIPHDLRPVLLRDELVELGHLFRAYQQRTEPDLALLADLHTRKAQAFMTWSDVTGDVTLRLEAQRAAQAATAARVQHQQRTGADPDGEGPTVERFLIGPMQWTNARSVLAHLADHAPLPGAEARLLAVMLTLRTAHTGSGNLVGQDINGLNLTDPEGLVTELAESGWLSLPCTAADVIAARPENPVPITVPSLVPGDDGTGPLTFGRKMRPKLSGWAQRVVSDKKLRKSKSSPATRMLALALAARTSFDGRLGGDGDGVDLDALTAWCPVEREELPAMVEKLSATSWLAEAALTDTRITGQVSERVLPLTCPCP
ncbi:hypothetical protein [Streptomyces sp. NBC_00102]|uniref:hypothetical protein n=1 Tax=Streptomyces sp. NBC_00102 TaxID=2975652 RepID=UPI00224FAE1C|nr:hypothetical protein [Streptomyces sp. NBC_00102]MCX5402128.1 hypothetical protein [Streptomyces sp. NBC_00102]